MLVSILIPAYNAERWIAATLRSALAQTWPKLEIVVVDDGSSDGTLTVAREFESEGVKVVTQKNAGAAAARNTAFTLSRGDYIQWLDADDLLGADKIALQMERALDLNDKRKLLSCGWATFSHRAHAVPFTPTPLWADLSPADWLMRKLGQNLHMQTATWLTSRELAEATGPWNAAMWVDDDGEYFCRVLLASSGVAFVPGAKVYYRTTDRHRLSLIGFSNRKKDAMLASMRFHIATLRSLEESERVRRACVQYLQNWLFAFYPERPDIVAELQQMAGEMGAHLEPPRLSWKYSWIKALMGWEAAKRAQHLLPNVRWTVQGGLEKTLYRVEKLVGQSPGN